MVSATLRRSALTTRWSTKVIKTDRGTRISSFQSSTTQNGIWTSTPSGRNISVNKFPMLITWGKNDGIFTVEGAELYKRVIPNAELHLLDTGHFALEGGLQPCRRTRSRSRRRGTFARVDYKV